MRLIINGLDLNDHTNGWTVQPDLEGFASLPTIRMTTGQNAGRDGGWSTARLYDARSLNVKGYIYANSIAELEQKRRQLMQALDTAEPITLQWVTDGGNVYSTKVRPTQITAPISKALRFQSYQLVLRADDPIWYDTSNPSEIVAELNVFKETGGFLIPFEIPLPIGGGSGDTLVTNTGTTTVWPLITIEGACHSPEIINVTTNESIKLLIDMEATDSVVIDTTPTMHTVVLNGTGNIYNTIAVGSEFPTLIPGQNRLRFVTDNESDTATAKIRYNSGYMGV